MIAACGGGNKNMIITIANITDITSPNFPENYPNNMDCTWIIKASSDEKIELHLEGFELEKE